MVLSAAAAAFVLWVSIVCVSVPLYSARCEYDVVVRYGLPIQIHVVHSETRSGGKKTASQTGRQHCMKRGKVVLCSAWCHYRCCCCCSLTSLLAELFPAALATTDVSYACLRSTFMFFSPTLLLIAAGRDGMSRQRWRSRTGLLPRPTSTGSSRTGWHATLSVGCWAGVHCRWGAALLVKVGVAQF